MGDKANNMHTATCASTSGALVVQKGLNGRPYVTMPAGSYFNVPTPTFVKTIVAVFRTAYGRTKFSKYGAVLNRVNDQSANWLFQKGKTYLHHNQYPAKVWRN